MDGHDFALLESPHLGPMLFQEAGDALFLVDPAHENVLAANPMAVRLTRLPREELLGLKVRELLHHEKGTTDWLDAVRETLAFHGRDGFLLRTDNPAAWVPVSLTISRLHAPSMAPLALFMVRDRSEQVEAFRRLQRTEQELRRVLVSVSDCLWSVRVDDAGRWHYRYLSPVVERITGRPVSYFMEAADAWESLIDPADLALWREFRAQTTRGNSAEVEYRLLRSEGAVCLRESVVVSPGEDAASHLLHGVISDVTSRKQAQQAQMDRELLETQKLESLGLLAGGIAHDFNNLLAGILGNASLARMISHTDAQVLHHLEMIETTCLRAADLCKQLLAYAGKARFFMAAINLNELIEETTDLLRTSISKKVRLVFHLAPDLPPIHGDATQLQQIIMNLVINASESFGDGEGVIQIATRQGTVPGDAGLKVQPPHGGNGGAYASLTVSDSGPGIAAELQPRIFEPFFTTKFAGRGLGLSAVQGIVRTHKGMISLQSAPGAGTSVTVWLPAAIPAAAAPAKPVDAPEEWKTHGTALLADDEESVRTTTSAMLKSMGFAVVEAVDGQDAVEKLESLANAEASPSVANVPENLRVILLDMTMPRQSANDILPHIKQRFPNVPVVLLSGYAEPDVLSRFAAGDLAAYLHKPFRMSDLMRTLRKVVESDAKGVANFSGGVPSAPTSSD